MSYYYNMQFGDLEPGHMMYQSKEFDQTHVQIARKDFSPENQSTALGFINFHG